MRGKSDIANCGLRIADSRQSALGGKPIDSGNPKSEIRNPQSDSHLSPLTSNLSSLASHPFAVVPLHVRSGYSLLRGTAMPGRLVELAKRLGHAHLAMTDVNNLCGATVFYKHARDEGVAPIIGAELTDNRRTAVALVFNETGYENLCRMITRAQNCGLRIADCGLKAARVRQASSSGDPTIVFRPMECGGKVPKGRDAALAGRELRNIQSGVVSAAADCAAALHRRAIHNPQSTIHNRPTPHSPLSAPYSPHPTPHTPLPTPHTPLPYAPADPFIADLVELSAGLHVIVQDAAVADELLKAGMSREQLWLGIDPATQSYGQVRGLVDFARTRGVAPVATGKALMAEKDDAELARLLAAIRTGSTFDSVAADELPHERAVLRSGEQITSQFAAFAQQYEDFAPATAGGIFQKFLADAIANNRRLAEECSAYKLLPRKAVFPDFPCPEGLSARDYLRRLCEEGVRRRYANAPAEHQKAAAERLDKELGLIDRLGFNEYFLVVWDIVRYARRTGAPVAGRGSGASSLAAYALGITNVCPLAYDIPFERFLHEGREDFPDLDVDFCWRIRDDVIDYAFRRWGADHVAMVSMHGTFQPASAFRETAKAMGLSDPQITQIARMEEGRTEAEDGKIEGGEEGRKGRREDRRTGGQKEQDTLARIARLSRKLLGLPHILSVHPGGIVIGRKTIDHYAPIQPAAKGVNITQYDKNGVEDIRLVKLDLLGNRNLSTVRYACDLVRRRRGVTVDIEALPPDDADTIAMLQRGDTVGCNQLESPAMRHLLKMMRPSDTRDVMKALALIRPGAASMGMKEAFIRRLRGLDPTPAEHPAIDPILGGTHGVMLYEDDVMLVAAALMGSSLSTADRFRKAIQKCADDRQRLRLSEEFLGRCRANGVDLEYAKGLWVQMAKYNAYSFCRAHAASYAALAYAAAWLKAHWPLEYWVSAMNNNQSMYPLRVYVEQARRQGIRFLLPDVNRSESEFAIEEETPTSGTAQSVSAIRSGLGHVGGLGPANVQSILAARAQRPFEGLSDCLARANLGRNEARSLVLCGAFDWTGRTRPTLMMEMNLFFALGAWRHTDDVRLLAAGPTIPNVPGDYDEDRKHRDERQILGFSVREHFMARCRPKMGTVPPFGTVPIFDLIDSRQIPSRVGQTVRIAGVIEAGRTTATQAGREMMFLTMDDEWGLFEVTLFPDVRRAAGPLNQYGPYVVTGRVEDQYGSISVSAEEVQFWRANGHNTG
ncbi:MAG: DNA polymerase III subunit alpha [Phycisphaerae bacterium]